MCYARDSSPGPHKQMLPNKLSILYENYSANFFLAESGYVAGKLESESRRAGGGMPPPPQPRHCVFKWILRRHHIPPNATI